MTKRVGKPPHSGEFQPGGDAQQVTAEVLARRAGRSRVARAEWETAAAIVAAMRENGFTLSKPAP